MTIAELKNHVFEVKNLLKNYLIHSDKYIINLVLLDSNKSHQLTTIFDTMH